MTILGILFQLLTIVTIIICTIVNVALRFNEFKEKTEMKGVSLKIWRRRGWELIFFSFILIILTELLFL